MIVGYQPVGSLSRVAVIKLVMIYIRSINLSPTVPVGKCLVIIQKMSLGREFWLGNWKGKIFIERFLCAKKLLI